MAEDMGKKRAALTRHFDKEQLANMTMKELSDLIGEAPPGTIFRGKAVVRRADGTIKYDEPDKAGSYGE